MLEKIDLNRNFPTWADVNKTVEELFAGRQAETRHMMRLILASPWVLSANFHDGAVVAAYPYNDYRVKPEHSTRVIESSLSRVNQRTRVSPPLLTTRSSGTWPRHTRPIIRPC